MPIQSRSGLILEDGFRPFFLLASFAAVVFMGAWIAMWRGAVPMPAGIDPIQWHAHEMTIGFVGAAFAGFLLTAVPNWTRRAPLRGWPIAFLAALWVMGRIVMSTHLGVPPGVEIAIDCAFPLTLVILIGREVALGGNWQNLVVVFALLVWAGANLGFHLAIVRDEPQFARPALLLGLHAVIFMVVVIGGRVIPAFTASWLRARGVSRAPSIRPGLERLSVPLTAVAGLLLVFAPRSTVTAAVALSTALLHAVRLAGWRGAAAWKEPLLLVLHVAYLWLIGGYLLLGISIVRPELSGSLGIHAFTTGGFGTMILAIMSRAALGHTGRALSAPAAVVGAYVLVSLAAITRLLASAVPPLHAELLTASGTLWVIAFLVFFVVYWPILTGPRIAGHSR